MDLFFENSIFLVSSSCNLNYNTVKHRSSDQLSSGKIVKLPKLSWFGNKLVRNFVARIKLVRKL